MKTRAEYIRSAQKMMGPLSLANAIELEARHRTTGTDRHVLALHALCQLQFLTLTLKVAETLSGADSNRESFEKFEKARGEAMARADAASRGVGPAAGPPTPKVLLASAGETEALKREHDIHRRQQGKRNKERGH